MLSREGATDLQQVDCTHFQNLLLTRWNHCSNPPLQKITLLFYKNTYFVREILLDVPVPRWRYLRACTKWHDAGQKSTWLSSAHHRIVRKKFLFFRKAKEKNMFIIKSETMYDPYHEYLPLYLIHYGLLLLLLLFLVLGIKPITPHVLNMNSTLSCTSNISGIILLYCWVTFI